MSGGEEFSDEDFEACFKEFDKDNSGTIEKDEMAIFIKKVAGLWVSVGLSAENEGKYDFKACCNTQMRSTKSNLADSRGQRIKGRGGTKTLFWHQFVKLSLSVFCMV